MNASNVGENAQSPQIAIYQEDEDGISVPNWLIDVLKWISRKELANSSLSYSCRMFKQLCWPTLHEEVKPHIVSQLEFYNDLDAFGNIQGILEYKGRLIPIAAVQPPEYILGFEQINIGFMDNRIIEFAKNLNGKINLNMRKFLLKWEENDAQLTLIDRLLSLLADNIHQMSFANYHKDGNSFSIFCRHFPAILEKLPFIDISHFYDSDFEIAFNWLMKRKADGGQKILNYIISEPNEDHQEMELRFINRLEEEFANSNEPANFLIVLSYEYAEFSLKNEFTGEVLNLYTESDSDGLTYSFLARYPEVEEQQWKNGNIAKISERENMINMILDMDEVKQMKNNKLDVRKSSPDLKITDEGFIVANSDTANGYNSVRAEMPVEYQHFCLSRLGKYIACYFEVQILNQCSGVGIGFSDSNFALKYTRNSRRQNSRGKINELSMDYNLIILKNSMGFWCKGGAHIDGTFKPFGNAESNESFSQNDVLGCGLLRSRKMLEFFATHNGTLLGLIELSDKLFKSDYFPTITLAAPSASVRANFGKEAFCFDRSKLFNEWMKEKRK